MLKDKILKSILLICLMIVWGNMWAQSPVKCTSTDDLKAGDVYYISAAEEYSSTASVMGMSTGGNYFPASTFGEAPCELTLGGNATSGWTFSYVDNGTTYYLDPTNTTYVNYLKRNTSITNYGKFTISFAESGAVRIISKGKSTRNEIKFESPDKYSCYSNIENAVYLYKKDGNINPDESQDYTVSFSVNGNIVQSKAYKENAAVTPPSVEAINSKAFVGWVKTSTVDAAMVPSYETITKATEDAIYYAVFADAQTGTGRVTDVLTRDWTGSTSSTYQSWSGKTLKSTAVYAGKTAGSNNSIQLRNTNKDEGIITTSSGGKAKTVTVEWNSNTASGRILKVYGKNNTAYNNVSEVFSSTKSTQGTELGTIVNGTSTSLTIDGDYEYIALASASTASGAMYLNSISIEWEGTTEVYSNFTTLPYAATITLNAACHDVDGIVYSTYSNGSAFVVPSDINVYEVAANGKSLSLHAYETGDVVPANTGVLVAANEGGNYTVALTNAAGTSILGTDNALRPSGNAGIAATSMNEGNGKMYYRLTMHNGTEFGFWWGAENGAAFGLAANKAYLVIDTTSSGDAKPAMGIVFNTNEATAISSVVTNNAANAVRYNLNGQRILSTRNGGGYKGIVIMNGKKYINK